MATNRSEEPGVGHVAGFRRRLSIPICGGGEGLDSVTITEKEEECGIDEGDCRDIDTAGGDGRIGCVLLGVWIARSGFVSWGTLRGWSIPAVLSSVIVGARPARFLKGRRELVQPRSSTLLMSSNMGRLSVGHARVVSSSVCFVTLRAHVPYAFYKPTPDIALLVL